MAGPGIPCCCGKRVFLLLGGMCMSRREVGEAVLPLIPSTSFLCSLGISSMKSSSVVRRSLAELSCVAKYDLRSAVS
ncbi:unnamed protein product [Cochlearia groenlandica]